ncbi:MAG TPA: DUF4349 domain-containing protein, partial [Anaerolineales bacterium]|nr:DUF4349 domain-containing protein [Anaerolineales bacterium]
MKKTLITIALTTLVLITLIGASLFTISRGFGGAPAYEPAAPAYESRSFAPISAPMPMAAEGFSLDAGGGYDLAYEESAVSSNVAATERLVIQNVDMSIVVVDPKARMKEIGDLAVEMGGFVVSSNLYQSSYGPNNIEVPEGSMTIRIPSESLDEALEKIKEDTVDITYENRSGEDVTSQYVDLQSRLSAKQD